MQEIEFWSRHSADLNALFHQLQSEASRQILRFLDFHRSTYSGPFAKLCKELFLARSEASNICKYLSPLREWAEKLEDLRSASEGEGIGHLQALFRPTLHVVLLIWRCARCKRPCQFPCFLPITNGMTVGAGTAAIIMLLDA
jgi:hypothetical protein